MSCVKPRGDSSLEPRSNMCPDTLFPPHRESVRTEDLLLCIKHYWSDLRAVIPKWKWEQNLVVVYKFLIDKTTHHVWLSRMWNWLSVEPYMYLPCGRRKMIYVEAMWCPPQRATTDPSFLCNQAPYLLALSAFLRGIAISSLAGWR